MEPAPGRPVLSMPVRRAFTVDLPPPRGAGRWVGLLAGFLIVGGFIAVGVFLMRDAGFFRFIWLGFNSIIALAMTAGMVSMVRNAGVVIRVSGDRNEIRVQRMRNRRVIGEKRMPSEGVEVRSYSNGRSNQTPMKQVELVGPHDTLPVVLWRAENEVDPFVGELRRHLGG